MNQGHTQFDHESRVVRKSDGQTQETMSTSVFPHRRVEGVVGDSSQSGLQGVLHEWSQHEQRFQVVTDGALRATVVFHHASIQQARLVE